MDNSLKNRLALFYAQLNNLNSDMNICASFLQKIAVATEDFNFPLYVGTHCIFCYSEVEKTLSSINLSSGKVISAQKIKDWYICHLCVYKLVIIEESKEKIPKLKRIISEMPINSFLKMKLLYFINETEKEILRVESYDIKLEGKEVML